jgi:DNA-binding transcriptional ArsR family regulator
MPRKRTVERHADSAPEADSSWPPVGIALVDAIVAVNHPSRRRLYEILGVVGPVSVGRLSGLTGMAAGSVSHHLKVLHHNGFVEPAPELRSDARESWWRAIHRTFSWSALDYGQGSVARQVAELAEATNLQHLEAATAAWIGGRETLPQQWRGRGFDAHMLLSATPQQFDDLADRLRQVTDEWARQVRQDQAERPGLDRLPVRAIVRVFPSRPGAPNERQVRQGGRPA